MCAFPTLGDATELLHESLRQSLLGTTPPSVVWLAREDFYAVRFGWYYYTDRPALDISAFDHYYNLGKSRGLASIRAIFIDPHIVGCTVWVPRPNDIQQGWDSGLKVSVSLPLGIGARVSSRSEWSIRRFSQRYRQWQRFAHDFPSIREIQRVV